MAYFIGVDIGGTFTDCVAVDEAGDVFHGKALSTHATSPVDGVIDGCVQLANAAGCTLEALLGQAERFSHGTTIGTNLVVERKGARVGLIATRGHGDALFMMRGNGRTAGAPNDAVFSVHRTSKPEPLVPRRLVAEVSERVLHDGTVLSELDLDSARDAIARLIAEQVDAVAVALMWGFRNPTHETAIRSLVEQAAPEMFVSISSETSPRQGEYERTVATVINSYVGPASSRYLDQLADELRSRGFRQRPFIMQANGGVATIDVARRLPVQTIGSGPAGGLAGTLAIANASGHSNVIATDMGGTSFEVGLVVDGRPTLTSEQVLDNYTFQSTQLDLRSIACGGGSIAHVDPHSGGLRVGPHSAGSDPGPACYGRGTRPTVTDADVVLGLIDPETFLGGRMRLDRDAASAAVRTVAEPLGLSIEETAAGIVRVNSHNAATLIRQRTIEQGLDPREFVLYAYGGAGPVHAFAFAAELDVQKVVVPMGNGASTLSAYGIAATDASRSFEQECKISSPFSLEDLQVTIEAVERRALAEMVDAGFDGASVQLERTALLRYAEQLMQSLPVVIQDGPIDAAAVGAIQERFLADYERLYGAASLAVFQAVEIFAVRVDARVPLGFAALGVRKPVAEQAPAAREVYWPDSGEWVSTAIHMQAPAPGASIDGPALIELAHTTVAVAPGQGLDTDPVGNFVMTL
jgi:N-methylhydantoinase A